MSTAAATPLHPDPSAPAAAAPGTQRARHAALSRALDAMEKAEARGQPALMAAACQRLARCYRALGAWPMAMSTLERAQRCAGVSGAIDQEVDLGCELAEWLADLAEAADRHERGSGRRWREQARDRVFQTTRLTARCADPRWEVTVLLRLSDVLDRFGDRDDATVLQVRALQLTVSEFYAAPAPRAEDAVSLRRH